MNPFARYRQEILGMVSDEDILQLICEGDLRNLPRLPQGTALRARISRALGSIERDQLGGVNAPEWTVASHNVLVEVFARAIEYRARLQVTA